MFHPHPYSQIRGNQSPPLQKRGFKLCDDILYNQAYNISFDQKLEKHNTMFV